MKHITLIIMALLLVASVGIVSGAPAPSCDFTASTTSGPEDLTVTFTATFEGISPPVTYEWDFGDDSGADKISGATVTHTYRNPGKYTVSLIVNDLGIPTTWWVRNTKTDYITVTNIPPVAAFSFSHYNPPVAPLNVVFDDLSTGLITSYQWDFGDGNSATSPAPEHTFAGKGDYVVNLTVSNDGGSDSVTHIVHVIPPRPDADFVSMFTTSGAKPFAVQFHDMSTYDGAITGWHWSFGDNSTSTEQHPLYVYTVAGTYPATLTVDSASGSSTVTKENFIRVLDEPTVCPEPTPSPTIVPVVCPTQEPVTCPTLEGAPLNNVGVFRPSSGTWYLDSDGNRLPDILLQYGKAGDIPLAGDFNGDAITDIAVFRPAAGNWYIDTNRDRNPDKTFHYGTPTDIPFAIDFNQDGKADMSVFRPSSGYWYIDTNLDANPDIVFQYGKSEDLPAFGDWG